MLTPIPLGRYRRVVVLTGAGISAASGLRTYRGPNGLWGEEGAMAVTERSTLASDPDRVWASFAAMAEVARAAAPNAAHLALAAFAQRLEAHDADATVTVLTQNVDGLHQRAGSRQVVELHGSLSRVRCSRDGCELEPHASDAYPTASAPPCPRCGAPLRFDVVLFEEALPVDAEWAAKRALRSCDLFLAVGTSGSVAPASSFVRWAEYEKARTILINLEPMTPPNPAFDEQILGRAEETLPALLGGS